MVKSFDKWTQQDIDDNTSSSPCSTRQLSLNTENIGQGKINSKLLNCLCYPENRSRLVLRVVSVHWTFKSHLWLKFWNIDPKIYKSEKWCIDLRSAAQGQHKEECYFHSILSYTPVTNRDVCIIFWLKSILYVAFILSILSFDGFQVCKHLSFLNRAKRDTVDYGGMIQQCLWLVDKAGRGLFVHKQRGDVEGDLSYQRL